MKKKSLLLLLISLLFMMPGITASAASVNSHEVKTGDIVSYEIRTAGCTAKIQAVDIVVYYDKASLQYVEDSFEMPELGMSLSNTEIEGEILFNAITLDGFDFSEDSLLAKMKFRVTDDLTPEISLSYTVRNFMDSDFNEYKDKYIYNITEVSGEESVSSSSEKVSYDTDGSSKNEVSSSAGNDSSEEGEVSVSSAEENSSVTENSSAVGSSESASSTAGEVTAESESASSAQSSDNTAVSSGGNDIPDDMAIRFDTLDKATPSEKNNSRYYAMLAVGVCVVIAIAAAFMIVLGSKNKKGSHFENDK